MAGRYGYPVSAFDESFNRRGGELENRSLAEQVINVRQAYAAASAVHALRRTQPLCDGIPRSAPVERAEAIDSRTASSHLLREVCVCVWAPIVHEDPGR